MCEGWICDISLSGARVGTKSAVPQENANVELFLWADGTIGSAGVSAKVVRLDEDVDPNQFCVRFRKLDARLQNVLITLIPLIHSRARG